MVLWVSAVTLRMDLEDYSPAHSWCQDWAGFYSHSPRVPGGSQRAFTLDNRAAPPYPGLMRWASARPTSAVPAVPPMSGVRGACASANKASMASTMSSWAAR